MKKHNESSKPTLFEIILNHLEDRKNAKWIQELERRKVRKEFNHEIWSLIVYAAMEAEYSNEWEKIIYNHKDFNIKIWEKIVRMILKNEMGIQLPFLSDDDFSSETWKLIKKAIFDYDNCKVYMKKLEKLFHKFAVISLHYYFMNDCKILNFMKEDFEDFFIVDIPKPRCKHIKSIVNGNIRNIELIIKLIKRNKYDDESCNIYEHMLEDDFKEIAMTPIIIPTESFQPISGEHILFILHNEMKFTLIIPEYNQSLTDAEEKSIIYHKRYEHYFGKRSDRYINRLSSVLKIPKQCFSRHVNHIHKDAWTICEAIQYVHLFKDRYQQKKRGQKSVFQIMQFPTSFSDIYADGNTTNRKLPEKIVIPILFSTLILQGIPRNERLPFSANIIGIFVKLLHGFSKYIALYNHYFLNFSHGSDNDNYHVEKIYHIIDELNHMIENSDYISDDFNRYKYVYWKMMLKNLISYIDADVVFLNKILSYLPSKEIRTIIQKTLVEKRKISLDHFDELTEEKKNVFCEVFPNEDNKMIMNLFNTAIKVIIRCSYKDQFDYMNSDESINKQHIKKVMDMSRYRGEKISLFNIIIAMWLAYIGKNVDCERAWYDKPKTKTLFHLMNNIQNYRSEALIYKINEALRVLSLSILMLDDNVDDSLALHIRFYDFLNCLFNAPISYADGIHVLQTFINKIETVNMCRL